MPKGTESGASWAKSQKRAVRTCETCKTATKECLAFVASAWVEIKSGRSNASRQGLHREIVRRFKYPFSCAGLRCHTDNCLRG